MCTHTYTLTPIYMLSPPTNTHIHTGTYHWPSDLCCNATVTTRAVARAQLPHLPLRPVPPPFLSFSIAVPVSVNFYDTCIARPTAFHVQQQITPGTESCLIIIKTNERARSWATIVKGDSRRGDRDSKRKRKRLGPSECRPVGLPMCCECHFACCMLLLLLLLLCCWCDKAATNYQIRKMTTGNNTQNKTQLNQNKPNKTKYKSTKNRHKT